MTEPDKPSPWVGRATSRPVDPWADDRTVAYGPPLRYTMPPPGYILVPAPAPPRRRGLRTVLFVVGIFAACCAGGATLALLGNAAWRGTGTFGSAPPGVNDPVRDGKFEFTVTSVSCGHESVGAGFVTKKAHGQFCVVDLSVENIGTKGQVLLDGVQKAIGPDGTEYGSDSGAGVVANAGTSVWVNMVNPGNKITGKIVFDLPLAGSIAKLVLHDSAFSTGATVTLT